MKKFLEYFLLGFVLFVALLGIWIKNLYGEITFNQLIFHLNLPLLDGINLAILWKFIRYCVLPLFVFLFLYRILCKKLLAKSHKIRQSLFVVLMIGFAFWTQKSWRFDELYHQSKIAISYGDFYETYYVAPQKENLIFPTHQRNLILIVLESMEATYSNPNFASPTLTPHLLKIAQENIAFKDIDSLGGGDTSLWSWLDYRSSNSLSLWNPSLTSYWG